MVALRRAAICLGTLFSVFCSASLFADSIAICSDSFWGYDASGATLGVRCSNLTGTRLYYEPSDYFQIIDGKFDEYYLPVCERPWEIFPAAGPITHSGYLCKNSDNTSTILPLSVSYLSLINALWISEHSDFYIPFCHSLFTTGGRGGEGAFKLRCIEADADQITVSAFVSTYLIGGGPMFLYCEGGSWTSAGPGEPVCSGSLLQYSAEELAQLIRVELVGSNSMLSISDFEIVLLSSILVLFAAWGIRRLVALVR